MSILESNFAALEAMKSFDKAYKEYEDFKTKSKNAVENGQIKTANDLKKVVVESFDRTSDILSSFASIFNNLTSVHDAIQAKLVSTEKASDDNRLMQEKSHKLLRANVAVARTLGTLERTDFLAKTKSC